MRTRTDSDDLREKRGRHTAVDQAHELFALFPTPPAIETNSLMQDKHQTRTYYNIMWAGITTICMHDGWLRETDLILSLYRWIYERIIYYIVYNGRSVAKRTKTKLIQRRRGAGEFFSNRIFWPTHDNVAKVQATQFRRRYLHRI